MEGLFVFLILTILLINYFIKKLFSDKNEKFTKFSDSLPGPTIIPFFGNELQFLFNRNDIYGIFSTFTAKYGKLYRLWLQKRLFVIISSVEEAKEILFSPLFLDKGDIFYRSFRRYFGNGLFTVSLPVWKTKRKLLRHHLHKNELHNYVPDIVRQCDNLVENWSSYAQTGEEFDAAKYIHTIPYIVVCKTMLNIEENSDDAKNRSEFFSEAASVALASCFNELFLPRIYTFFMKITRIQLYKKIQANMDATFHKVMSLGVTAHRKQIDSERQGFKKFIFYLINDFYTEKDIKDEIVTWTTGGSETISSTLNFGLLMLAMHQDVQIKVYEEICQVLPPNVAMTVGDIEKLIYLDQVIKETHRCFPLVPFLFRRASRGTKIGDYNYPAGTYVIVNVREVMRDKRYFPNPDVFDPDHYSPERAETLPKALSLGFSIGPRDCIGKAFALLQLKIVLIKIVQHFRIETNMQMKDLKIICNFTTTNATGFKLRLKMRD